jgi:two-component system KDP operon response regulator KdpE
MAANAFTVSDGELILRLESLSPDDGGGFGVTCPLEHHEATLGDQPLKLSPTEYALLSMLVRHAGEVVTLKHLLRAVWGPHAEEQTQYLRVYANHLRKKLDGSGLEILNEPGIGYRLRERG